MKTKSKFLILFVLLTITSISCKKNSYKGNGWAVFSTPSNTHGSVYVSVEGSTTKASVISNPDFDCNDYKGYNGSFLLDVGTHNYSATADDGKSWSGTLEIFTDNDCIKIRLQ